MGGEGDKDIVEQVKVKNVMKKDNANRTKWLHVRLTDKEFEALQKQFSKTTQRKISGYARDILLGKPMVGSYRNQSLQDILAELSKLRKDLNGIANNFNQAVHKLHVSDNSYEVKTWVRTHENIGEELLKHITQVHAFINKTAEKWLRS